MLQPRDSVHGVYFNIEKEESGVWLSTKNMFFSSTEGRFKCVNTFVYDCRSRYFEIFFLQTCTNLFSNQKKPVKYNCSPRGNKESKRNKADYGED